MKHPINWKLIGEAVDFYQTRGYHYIEAPWIVSQEAVDVTMPEGHFARTCQEGPLVGSAEQGFIHLMLDGTLQPGRHVAAGPCFRDDDRDEWHQTTFFKVELIHFSKKPFENPPQTHVKRMLLDAAEFFWVAGAEDIEKKETAEGWDIELAGIELGSYGYRNFKDFHWIYGTGLAEPRFSQALKYSGNF